MCDKHTHDHWNHTNFERKINWENIQVAWFNDKITLFGPFKKYRCFHFNWFSDTMNRFFWIHATHPYLHMHVVSKNLSALVSKQRWVKYIRTASFIKRHPIFLFSAPISHLTLVCSRTQSQSSMNAEKAVYTQNDAYVNMICFFRYLFSHLFEQMSLIPWHIPNIQFVFKTKLSHASLLSICYLFWSLWFEFFFVLSSFSR